MTDIAADIREAVNKTRPPEGLRHGLSDPPEEFLKLRAHVRGTLISASRELVGDEWSVTTDRILDIVTTWLESMRRK